jgi:flagellar export protein FliJ
MKPFHFRLRALGVLRTHRERLAREALAGALRARTEAETRLNGARARTAELARLRPAMRSALFRPAEDVAYFQAYRRECAAEAEALQRWHAAGVEVETRRQACVEAKRETEVIDRLEDRARLAHSVEGWRAAQNEADDNAGARVRRPVLR